MYTLTVIAVAWSLLSIPVGFGLAALTARNRTARP